MGWQTRRATTGRTSRNSPTTSTRRRRRAPSRRSTATRSRPFPTQTSSPATPAGAMPTSSMNSSTRACWREIDTPTSVSSTRRPRPPTSPSGSRPPMPRQRAALCGGSHLARPRAFLRVFRRRHRPWLRRRPPDRLVGPRGQPARGVTAACRLRDPGIAVGASRLRGGPHSGRLQACPHDPAGPRAPPMVLFPRGNWRPGFHAGTRVGRSVRCRVRDGGGGRGWSGPASGRACRRGPPSGFRG